MKVLITGGAGFIASHVADRYLALGHEVAIVDNLCTGFRHNLPEECAFHELDIRSPELLAVFEAERPALVNHHAAQMDVRKSVSDPLFDAAVNVLGSCNVLECARKTGVERMIYASTGGAVYGEPEWLPVTEDHPLRPACPYGISKHTVEHYLENYRLNYGIEYAVLRYPNVFGPRQDPKGEAGVVAIFCLKMLAGEQPVIFGDGSMTRDYTYIDDVVQANMLVSERGTPSGVYNVGHGLETSVGRVFAAVKSALGADLEPLHAPQRLGEIDRICLDARRFRELTGWKPAVSFDEGIRRCAEFYRDRLAGRRLR